MYSLVRHGPPLTADGRALDTATPLPPPAVVREMEFGQRGSGEIGVKVGTLETRSDPLMRSQGRKGGVLEGRRSDILLGNRIGVKRPVS